MSQVCVWVTVSCYTSLCNRAQWTSLVFDGLLKRVVFYFNKCFYWYFLVFLFCLSSSHNFFILILMFVIISNPDIIWYRDVLEPLHPSGMLALSVIIRLIQCHIKISLSLFFSCIFPLFWGSADTQLQLQYVLFTAQCSSVSWILNQAFLFIALCLHFSLSVLG